MLQCKTYSRNLAARTSLASLALTCLALSSTASWADITNSVTATATYSGQPVSSQPATASVKVDPPAPKLVIVKKANPSSGVGAGQTVTYTYDVTNTGNVSVSNISLTDTHNGNGAAPVPANETLTTPGPAGASASTDDNTANNGIWGTLAPLATVTFTGSYTLQQADFDKLQSPSALTNTVTVNGKGPSNTAVQASGNASVALKSAAPAITLVEAANLVDGSTGVSAKGDPGEPIQYSYKVKNTGNVTLQKVTLTDHHDGQTANGNVFVAPTLSNDAAPTGDSPSANASKVIWDVLAPGDEVTFTSSYQIVQADLNANGGGTTPDGTLHDSATVTGDYINPAIPKTTTVSAADQKAIPLDIAPLITVSKTADKTSNLIVGDVVTYTVKVTNSGNTDFTNVSLADTFTGGSGTPTPLQFSGFTPGKNPGNLAALGTQIPLLPAGTEAVYTTQYTITQQDLDAQ